MGNEKLIATVDGAQIEGAAAWAIVWRNRIDRQTILAAKPTWMPNNLNVGKVGTVLVTVTVYPGAHPLLAARGDGR
jgi:hypothetical protein